MDTFSTDSLTQPRYLPGQVDGVSPQRTFNTRQLDFGNHVPNLVKLRQWVL